MLGTGALQLERNIIASTVKLLALGAFSVAGAVDGMTVFGAWLIGTLVSLPVVAWRTRGGRALQDTARLIDLARSRVWGGPRPGIMRSTAR